MQAGWAFKMDRGVGVATGTLELDPKYHGNFKWSLSDWSQVKGML